MRKYIAQLSSRAVSKGRYEHLKLMKDFQFKDNIQCTDLHKHLLFNIGFLSFNPTQLLRPL